jgi:hypothetical protein
VSRAASWCAAPPPLLATDDDRQAAKAVEFWKKPNAMVAVADDVKKRYDVTRVRVLVATALLEEEEHVATILAEEACAAAALIKPPSPTLPPGPIGHAAPSNDDYEAPVITNIHI